MNRNTIFLFLPSSILLPLLVSCPGEDLQPVKGTLFVSGEARPDYWVIDEESGNGYEILSPIPASMVLDSTGSIAHAVCSGYQGIAPFSTTDGTLIDVDGRDFNGISISTVGELPWFSTPSSVRDRLYLSDPGSSKLYVISIQSGSNYLRITGEVDIPGTPGRSALGREEQYLFLLDSGLPYLYVISLADLEVVSTISLPEVGHSIAKGEGTYLYVTLPYSESVITIDGTYFITVDSISLSSPCFPTGIAGGMNSKYLYTACFEGGKIYVIDTDARSDTYHKVIRDIAVGAGPSGLEVSDDGNYLFSANFFSGDVSVVDLKIMSEVDMDPETAGMQGLSVCSEPQEMDLASTKVAVSCPFSNDMTIFEMGSWESISFGPGGGRLAVDSSKNRIYIPEPHTGSVMILSYPEMGLQWRISGGPDPVAVDYDPEMKYLYVLSRGGGYITVYEYDLLIKVLKEVEGESLNPIQVGPNPQDLVVDPECGIIYVSNEEDDSISVVEAITFREVNRIRGVGKGPAGLALYISDREHILFSANSRDNSVSMMDVGGYCGIEGAGMGTLLASAQAGVEPWDLALNDGETTVYSADRGGSTVSVIDFSDVLSGGGSPVLSDSINVGTAPSGLHFSSENRMLYCANSGDGTISIIDTDSLSLHRVLYDAGSPSSVVWLPVE